MKAKNLDFVLREMQSILSEALVQEGITLNERAAITDRVRKTVQNEYKYLLRGPRHKLL